MARVHMIETNNLENMIPKSPEKRWIDNIVEKPMTDEELNILMSVIFPDEDR